MSKIQDALKRLQEKHLAAQESTVRTETGGSSGKLDDSIATLQVRALSDLAKDRYKGKLVAIDRTALRSAGLLGPEEAERRLAEQYRRIKRPLLANAAIGPGGVPEKGNILMVASALSGEGKSFTCINLSLSLAVEKDRNILLIDGDVAKPHLSTLFDARGEMGLLDLLRDESLDLDDLVMPTDVPNLSILPTGRQDLHASEMLSSRRMTKLVKRLWDEDPFRITVFDSSPILLTSESSVLADHVGQIALVIRAGHTSQQAVLNAIEKLDREKPINAILNQVTYASNSSNYGYYGYGSDFDLDDATG